MKSSMAYFRPAMTCKQTPPTSLSAPASARSGGAIAVIGVANGVALGTAGVLPLAQEVLRVVANGGEPNSGGGRHARSTYGQT